MKPRNLIIICEIESNASHDLLRAWYRSKWGPDVGKGRYFVNTAQVTVATVQPVKAKATRARGKGK